MHKLTISVDGNIGAGKSTVLQYIHEHTGVAVDLEQVEKWQPYLERVYKQGDGVFELQVRVWLDRCFPKAHAEEGGAGTIMVERSPLFQAGVFVPVNVKAGKFTADQIAILKDMYAMPQMISPDIYVYLRSDPVKCAERINKRARESEEMIPLAYVQDIHTLHEVTYLEAVADKKKIVMIDVEGKSVAIIAAQVLQGISDIVNEIYGK